MRRIRRIFRSDVSTAQNKQTVHIVTGPDAAGLARQQLFFTRHIAPWFEALCDALEGAPEARFYPRTAALVRAYFEIERLAFDML